MTISSMPTSRYGAIAEEIVRQIAAGELAPGGRLPPVRQAASRWGVNLNTVHRAYLELAARGIVESHAGGGTRVALDPSPGVAATRDPQLRQLFDQAIGTALAQGHAPEAIEAVFVSQLTRWREIRSLARQQPDHTRQVPPEYVVRVGGSDDLAIALLGTHLRQAARPVAMRIQASGSLAGLVALANDECDLAGCHLLDPETGDFNLPFVRRVLPGQPVNLVTLSQRQQGLIVAARNPKRIRDVSDLTRQEVRFVNRQRGAGTRVFLDLLLAQRGITPDQVNGYEHEAPTHLAVTSAIAAGLADAGLGIGAAAHALGLEFVPLAVERYELAYYTATAARPAVRQVLRTLRSPSFTAAVRALTGYDTRETGRVRVAA
jgi:molybdate-binding protein/DNA-binding transcriptional regulator YhcF (GntR family)